MGENPQGRSVPAVHQDVISTVLADIAQHTGSEVDAAWLAHRRALQARSDAARNLLAAGAMNGATWEEVATSVQKLKPRDIARMDPKLAAWWRALGRVTVLQATSVDDTRLGVAFYDTAVKLNPTSRFQYHHYVTFVQALWDSGQRHGIRDVLVVDGAMPPTEAKVLELDLIGAESGADSDEWLRFLNREVLGDAGLDPLRFSPEGRTLFDRLERVETQRGVDGPLITVVMTTYRRHNEILTSVRSILNQSWRNIELLIVDDCSGPEFRPVLEEIARVDPRIRVITQEENSGAYMGRNRALAEARGTYITFQDDDDWSHPQRLERQVKVMLADPAVHSTLSWCFRVNEQMESRNKAQMAVRLNSSSLMFRNADLPLLGGFDTVRKAGDSEFIRRLQLGLEGTQVVLEEVLAFVRLTVGSLSRTEFSPSWRHPSRGEYWESCYRWYEDVERFGTAVIDTSGETRSFPAPRRFLGVAALAHMATEYDLVVAADWCSNRVWGTRAWNLLLTAISQGMTVGIVSLDIHSGRKRPGKKTAPEVRELIHQGVIDHVLPTDEVGIASLLVDGPHLLEFVDRTPWQCRVASATVIVDESPAEATTSSLWSVADVESALDDLFAIGATWQPSNGVVRDVLGAMGIETRASEIEPFLARYDLEVPPRIDHAVPVIGRLTPDDIRGWPADDGDLASVYPVDRSLDVRVLGRGRCFGEHVRVNPGSWLRFGDYDLGLRAFLQQLDFYVHFGADRPSREDTGVILAAAAAGRVVILDPSYEPMFGNLALYCSPSQVANLIGGLHADADAYKRQVATGRNVLSTRFGAAVGSEVLAGLVTGHPQKVGRG